MQKKVIFLPIFHLHSNYSPYLENSPEYSFSKKRGKKKKQEDQLLDSTGITRLRKPLEFSVSSRFILASHLKLRKL